MRIVTARKPPSYLAAIVPLAVCLAFWARAWPRARGFFPAPLDDVYIHFDFARSLAHGGAFEWIRGQGYSSGETSPLYMVALAAGWLLGFTGKWIGAWAAIVTVASLASLVRSVHVLVSPCPRPLAWALSSLPFAIAIVDWTLVSGMEAALTCALLGRALVALARARSPARRRGTTLARAQWLVGAWGAALVLARPEAVVLVAVVAVLAARGAGARSGLAALLRASLPGAAVTSALLATNLVATGDMQAAGARLKLLSSNPYLSDVARARIFVENVVVFVWKGLRAELAVVPWLGVLVPLLAFVALVPRSPRRATAAACLGGALAWSLLASWNSNAPYHNFRYYAPPLVLVLIGAAMGLAAIARAMRGRGAIVSAALFAVVAAAAAPRFAAQTSHYARSVANIRDQHVEMGLRLAARTGASARVLVGDAGAMPFVSSRGAIDALGLGGYRRLPFARAAVHGEAATLELLEHVAPSERPTHLALYPNWFGATTARFGVEIDRVTIDDNVICGGPTKVLYRADWSALDDARAPSRRALDEIDVADVVSERAHDYAPPLPHGGWTTLDVLADASTRRTFDGGRVIPRGARESFRVQRAPSGPVRIVVRVDAAASPIRVRARGRDVTLAMPPSENGRWREGEATLDALGEGDLVELTSDGEYRDYHVWIDPAP